MQDWQGYSRFFEAQKIFLFHGPCFLFKAIQGFQGFEIYSRVFKVFKVRWAPCLLGWTKYQNKSSRNFRLMEPGTYKSQRSGVILKMKNIKIYIVSGSNVEKKRTWFSPLFNPIVARAAVFCFHFGTSI